jgi:hypothetical protein
LILSLIEPSCPCGKNSGMELRKRLVWHYTTGYYLERIIKTQTLLPTEKGIEPGERPALWFSKEQHWEPTAQKRWPNPDGTYRLLGMLGTYQHVGGLGRIGVDPDRVELCDFATFVATSGIPQEAVRKMRRVGREQRANPRNWLVSFAPVRSESWAAVQVYSGTRWVEIDRADWLKVPHGTSCTGSS